MMFRTTDEELENTLASRTNPSYVTLVTTEVDQQDKKTGGNKLPPVRENFDRTGEKEARPNISEFDMRRTCQIPVHPIMGSHVGRF